ncbi:MAG: 3'-5' exonuclease [Lachnospiraceae bacterium]
MEKKRGKGKEKEKEEVPRLPGLTREEEEKQLAYILAIAQENLEHAQEEIRKVNEDLADLLEVYEAKEKEGLTLWNNATTRLQETEQELVRLKKARKKPYFGRIDFKDPRMKTEEAYYIGRVGITKHASEPVVLDWRAPIASVYYESQMGPCSYTVLSEGTYKIDLKRKRTYEIEQDTLKDFYDSDVVANDALLTKYLAKNKKAVLGEIIATIQEEQNRIIRRSPKTNMIVQGAAGSGKTTVAMHRISYILYNYKDLFRAQDFYVIGSNPILLNYITGVLPELDVYGIRQMTMEELFVRLLYEDWDADVYSYCVLNQADGAECIKGTWEWFHDLERFCQIYEETTIPHQNIYLEKTGVLLLTGEQILQYLSEEKNASMQSKIGMLNERLYAKYENEVTGKSVTFPPKERKILDKKYAGYFGNGIWNDSIFSFYRRFLQAQAEMGKRVSIPETVFDVYDLAALAYIYKRIKETDPIREASHVVVDEAQDFGMMAYASLKYCMRGCTYTIMGDTSQNINDRYGLNDWDELRSLILTGPYDSFCLLQKSYRNTVEISEFANEILRHGSFAIYPVKPIIRHGKKVEVRNMQKEADRLAETVKVIKDWQQTGYETIAVICRDTGKAEQIAAALKQYVKIEDCNPECAEFGEGVMVLPVAYTKGLEFDAVILYDPSKEAYPENDGNVKLLYVAATRALHELVVVSGKELTDILAKKVPEGKKKKEFAVETQTVQKEYQKTVLTQKECEEQRRIEGDRNRSERDSIGPRKIVVKSNLKKQEPELVSVSKQNPNKKAQSESLAAVKQDPYKQVIGNEKNNSPYAYGSVPDTSVLTVKGHSRNNFAVKWTKRTKTYVELASAYGMLRFTPITEEVIRVSFVKGVTENVQETRWRTKPETPFAWSARESRTIVEIATKKVVITVDKRTGAITFWNEKREKLLCERTDQPRLIEEKQTWNFFDWDKGERLKAKGILDDELTDLTTKARYISFGGGKPRMPLVLSNKGYAIAVAASETVLFCNIKIYGQYLYTEGDTQIDYYFIYGQSRETSIALYKKLNL